MARIVEVVPYDASWPRIFETEAKLLQDALGSNCVAIHHIGSTSVSGIHAKPIIDIIPVVKTLSDINDNSLIALGYTPRGEMGMPFRKFYNKGEPQRTQHLHIWEAGNPEIEKHLLFRDYLRTHPNYAKKYSDLKLKLAEQFKLERKNYTESKDSLIKEIIGKSGFSGLTVVQVNLPNEWESYKKIQQDNNPVISDNDIYFVLMQGVDIKGAAHIQKEPIAKILSLKCETTEQENYMNNLLERWIKQALH